MPILDIQRRVHEIGRIRLGEQGANAPRALPTFRFTSVRKELMDQCAQLFGGNVQQWNDQWQCVSDTDTLDVLIPPEDVAFSQYWELWSGGGCERRCDGFTELLSVQPCVCDAEGQRNCDATTRLNVLLPDFNTFGVWRVETHSYYAAAELRSAVEIALGMAARHGAHLAHGTLRIERRAIKRPGDPVRRFNVLVLDVALTSARALQAPENVTQDALSVAGLPAPAPRVERGAPSPEPAPMNDDDAQLPVLPGPLGHNYQVPGQQLARPVDAPPADVEDAQRKKDLRRMFAALKKAVPDLSKEDSDRLRAALAILESGKERIAVTSWNDLTDVELSRVEHRIADIAHGAMAALPQDDGSYLFRTSTGREAQVRQLDNGTWTFEVHV